MDTLKKIVKKIAYPGRFRSVLIVLSGFGLLAYICAAKQSTSFLAYAAYVLADYALLILAANSLPVFRKIRRRLEANLYARRWLSEPEYRARTSLYAGLLIDSVYIVFKAVLRADFVMVNPPFNLSDWGADKLADDPRWQYGMPPAGNANFAWLQHMIYHLAPGGRIGMVLANGSLSSQSGGEGEIRKNIIEADLVDCIIAMPTQLFYTTQIPVSLWFLSRDKKQKKKTLFIDARKLGTMVTRKLRELTDEDIQKIADTYNAFVNGTLEDVKGFCAAVPTEEIARQDYILTPGRYVGIEEQEDDGEPFEEKMGRLTAELGELFVKSYELEKEIRERLGEIGYEL